MLDRETLTAAVLHLGNALGDLVDLLLKEPFLTLSADGDFLKLAVDVYKRQAWCRPLLLFY